MFSTSLAALCLLSAASATVHDVIVGGAPPNQISYQPEALGAAVGDIVRFTFKQKNHTVTQTSFANVCQPLLDPYTQKPVLDSGFKPVGADQTSDFPTWDYTVTTTEPVWLFCQQTGHCGQGMVFSINCPASGDHSFDNFKKAALAFGAAQSSQAAAPSSQAAYPSYQATAPEYQATAPSSWVATATSEVYGDHTYAPVYHPTVTDTVSMASETWTTVYESYPGSPAPTPADPKGVEHRVMVGANGSLTYDPPTIKAAPRDTIVFEFRAKNHTVTQSSFGDPCRKLEFTSTTGEKGFDSGFMPVDASVTSNFPTFSITVNDTAPIWVYCRQTAHCGQGMVFAVNPNEASDRNFAAFVQLAKTLNGTAAANSNSTGQTANLKGAASAVRASMASAALLVVGGFFVLAL